MKKSRRAILDCSMKRLFRTLLLWLMIAVLPLHAAAAVIGMPCGNMHSNAPATLAEHHGDTGMDSHQAVHESHEHDAAAHSAGDDGSHSTCSACSAFCSAPPVPATAHIAVPGYDGSETLVAAHATLASGFIPEGPRRPPRFHSV